MKCLLTSAGINNKSIQDALVGLLGKPIAESRALCIPTAVYAIPGGAGHAWQFLSGQANTPMCELGWKSMGVLELTALPGVSYAIDDQTAIKVIDGEVEVVSEGHWKLFSPSIRF